MISLKRLAARLAGLARVIAWIPMLTRYNATRRPQGLSDKFVSAMDVIGRIPDGAVVISSGIAAHARSSLWFWAVRDHHRQQRSPAGLTWIACGAQGGRSKLPGTIEEMAREGLIAELIAGHHETHKAFYPLARQGLVELHTLPQGQISLLIAGQVRGETSRRTSVGVHTFLDPRSGRGSAVTDNPRHTFVRVDGDELVYSLPAIEVALVTAPYADADGNIYFRDAAALTEVADAVRAARANGGMAAVCVADIIERNDQEIAIGADEVDYIVVHRYQEQTGSVRQRHPLRMLTAGAHSDVEFGQLYLRTINKIMRITPNRGPLDDALARTAAELFTTLAESGDVVSIGVGLPEEVGRLLHESGLGANLTFTSEAGVWGGVPASGIFFGAAINPERVESSSWMFTRYLESLAVACFGLLEFDEHGNVNVSHRGDGVENFVGPGGFIDIAAAARKIVFVGNWMAGARATIDGQGNYVLSRPGTVKFVPQVHTVTFSGAEALRTGTEVYYVCSVGVFQLTQQGMTLIRVAKGVDIDRDIRNQTQASFILPEDGSVPLLSNAVMRGHGFRLSWGAA